MARPFRGVINVDVRAWAFNTPFKLWKRYLNFEGGTADPMIVSWPAQIASTGLRRQYVHAIDIAPTLYSMKYAYNFVGDTEQIVESAEPLPTGHMVVSARRGTHGVHA
jgi:arylsulfatase A-like enzyme